MVNLTAESLRPVSATVIAGYSLNVAKVMRKVNYEAPYKRTRSMTARNLATNLLLRNVSIQHYFWDTLYGGHYESLRSCPSISFFL